MQPDPPSLFAALVSEDGGAIDMAEAALLIALGACGGEVASAGNASIQFAGALQAKNYGAAYDLLCSSVRERFTSSEFIESEGLVVSPMLVSGSWTGTGRARPRDIETMDGGVHRASREYVVKYVPPGGFDRDLVESTWRVGLVREGDAWKLCSFDQVA